MMVIIFINTKKIINQILNNSLKIRKIYKKYYLLNPNNKF